ncbi:MAG: hypothetical protein WCK18_19680 [Prolixibacteraceae bacterium]
MKLCQQVTKAHTSCGFHLNLQAQRSQASYIKADRFDTMASRTAHSPTWLTTNYGKSVR